MPIRYSKLFVMFPPRPDGSSRPEDITPYPGWWAQRKYNGTRTLVFLDPSGEVHLYNRHKELHRAYKMTEEMRKSWDKFRTHPNLKRSTWSVFDGELLHSKTTGVKDRIVLFDVLVHNGTYLTGSSYGERYSLLSHLCRDPASYETTTGNELALHSTKHIWLAEVFTLPEDKKQAMRLFREKTELDEIEGLVLKDPGGKLKPGVSETNNSSWLIRVRKGHKNYRY